MVTRRKKEVLLLIESSHVYGRELLRGISQYVHERDHWWIHFEGRGLYESNPSWYRNWKGDGIIARSFSTPMCRQMQRMRCPVVELLGDGRMTQSEVRNNEQETGRSVVHYFRELGLRHLAFYGYGNSWWMSERLHHFRNAVRENGLEPYVFLEAPLEQPSIPSGMAKKEYRELARWLKKLPRPVGLMAATDPMGIRVMNVCRHINLRIPDDVAVLGMDNDFHLCTLVTPTLSSLDHNAILIGYDAARLLDLRMEGHAIPPLPIMITPGKIYTRKSTDLIASEDPLVAEILRFIREEATHGIQISDVLEKFDISARWLQRAFRNLLGRTPEQEMIRTRLKKARELLEESTISIQEIARNSGFHSPEYFVRTFRKFYGISPSQHRRVFSRMTGFTDEESSLSVLHKY